LECITLVHGPVIYSKGEIFKNPIWALRYKLGLGPNLPPNLSGGVGSVPKLDLVKVGFLQKAGPDGNKWNRRYIELTKDGRLIYFADKDGEAKGFVDLSGYWSYPTTASSGKHYAFVVRIDEKERMYKFSAESDADAQDWMSKINDTARSWQGSQKLSYTKPPKSNQVPDKDEDPIVTQILEYWFQNIDMNTETIGPYYSFWFTRNGVVDKYITAAFGTVLNTAIAGGCDNWLKTQRGTMALIILLDQFTRNIYRDTPQMFMGDGKALAIVENLLKTREDLKYPPYMCLFFYMVLSRPEDVIQLERFLSMHKELQQRTGGKIGAVKIAETQLGILKQFGRFPNRNVILGRKSTDKEVAFLKSAKALQT